MKWILGLIVGTAVSYAVPLRVVTSTTDLAWLVREIGSKHVEVTSFLKGTENPHYVDAVPEFIRLASNANAAFLVGLELEVGWMPKVLARSSNRDVQPGGKGYFEVGQSIAVLEKQGGVATDRSMGDVHPAGNPHFWLSPIEFGKAAGFIREKLQALDPVHASEFQSAAARVGEYLQGNFKRNKNRMHPMQMGTSKLVVMEYHKEFSYFFDAYGISSVGTLEEKPGVLPSAGRLAEVATLAKAKGVQFILASDTAPKKTVERFTELSGIPAVFVPLSVTTDIPNYGILQDRLVQSIIHAWIASQKKG